MWDTKPLVLTETSNKFDDGLGNVEKKTFTKNIIAKMTLIMSIMFNAVYSERIIKINFYKKYRINHYGEWSVLLNMFY